MSDPIKTAAPFKLSQGDRLGDTWPKLKRHLLERQAYLRVQNEADLDERQTATIRGKLAEIGRLLDLDKEINFLPPG